jgi:hypothetical protein
MDDELTRWAAERAPALIARAEQEAVAVMRDALVDAARRERRGGAVEVPRSAGPTAPASTPGPTGELVWAYCVARASAATPLDGGGVSGAAVERIEAAGLVALVSRVPAAQFAEQPLRENLNDLAWLERVARAHEAVLERSFALTTIVPLRLCTLYEDEAGVSAMLEREHAALDEALERLHGRQEWGVKVIVDPERLAEAARASSPDAATFEEELTDRSAGGAYILRRRLERHVRERAESLAADVAAQVHARLQDWALDAVTHGAQNRDLSGHEGDMLLNGAYLLEAHRADGLRVLVAELEAHHRDLGARIELTGPWPPFNFVAGART